MPEIPIVAVPVLLFTVAWLCWAKAKLHQDLADAYALIGQMLMAPDQHAAEALAAAHRERKIAEGRWKA